MTRYRKDFACRACGVKGFRVKEIGVTRSGVGFGFSGLRVVSMPFVGFAGMSAVEV